MSSYQRVLKIVLGFIGLFMLALVMANPLQIFANPISLIYLEVHKDGVNGVDGLGGAIKVTVSPDGSHVYVSAFLDDSITLFSRNSSTGALTYVETYEGHPFLGLIGAQDVIVSPDGNHVYTAASDSTGIDYVAVFSRDSSTGALTYV